jgi:hypothetical protein
MKQEYCIYHHLNPATGIVFYVGMGKPRRALQFDKRGKMWEDYVAEHGKPKVVIVLEGLTIEEAKAAEIEHIKALGRIGKEENGILVNRTEGGDLCSLYGPDNPRWGVKLSDETKRKISESNLRPEVVKSKSEKLTGIKRSDETRQKMREHRLANPLITRPMAGKKHRPESIEKMSDAHKGQLLGADNAKSKAVVAIDKDGNVVAEYESMHIAARETGAIVSTISGICNGKGKSKTSGGYAWKYKE